MIKIGHFYFIKYPSIVYKPSFKFWHCSRYRVNQNYKF